VQQNTDSFRLILLRLPRSPCRVEYIMADSKFSLVPDYDSDSESSVDSHRDDLNAFTRAAHHERVDTLHDRLRPRRSEHSADEYIESADRELDPAGESTGVRSRVDYTHAHLHGHEYESSRAGHESVDSGDERNDIGESAPKRRRTDIDDTEHIGRSAPGLVAGSQHSKRILGARYAAHALFNRQVAIKERVVDPVVSDGESAVQPEPLYKLDADSTALGAVSVNDVESSASYDAEGSTSTEPSVAEVGSGMTPEYQQMLAWYQFQQQQYLQYAAAMGMPMPIGGMGFPVTAGVSSSSGAPVMDAAAANRMRLEKVSRRELGIDMLGRDAHDREYAAALAAAANPGDQPTGMIEMRGADLMPVFDGSSVFGPGAGGAALRATKVGGIATPAWDSDAGEVSVNRDPSRMHKRKHQINHLAMQANARALQVAAAASQGAQARRMAHQKYGW
jgi:hypothetical protein